VREVRHFGFLLKREVEPLPSPFPEPLAAAARAALVAALLAGETPHPDQTKLRRGLVRLGEYWRRSGGTLAAAATDRLAERIAGQVAGVQSWEDFLSTRVSLEVEAIVPQADRERLDALPNSLHLYGDRVPLEYDVEGAVAVVRLQLKEGQARRLQPRDLPALDRPLRFTVLRGKRRAVRGESLEDLRRQLSELPRVERTRMLRGGRRPRRR
jgi:hypothetical protein